MEKGEREQENEQQRTGAVACSISLVICHHHVTYTLPFLFNTIPVTSLMIFQKKNTGARLRQKQKVKIFTNGFVVSLGVCYFFLHLHLTLAFSLLS